MSTDPELGLHETEWGTVYKAYRKTKEPGMLNYREHHLLMPGISCGGSGGRYLNGGQAGTPVSAERWRAPIDNTHTIMARLRLQPCEHPATQQSDPVQRRERPRKAIHTRA